MDMNKPLHVDDPKFYLLEWMVDIRETFEKEEHTARTVSRVMLFMRSNKDDFTFEQKKALLKFVNSIVQKYLEKDSKKRIDWNDKYKANLYYLIGRAAKKDEYFFLIGREISSGHFHFGHAVSIISNVIERLETGYLKETRIERGGETGISIKKVYGEPIDIDSEEIDAILRIPEEFIRDYATVGNTYLGEFKKSGKHFARVFNEIVAPTFSREILQEAMDTEFLDKTHERKHRYFENFFNKEEPPDKKTHSYEAVQAIEALAQGKVGPFAQFIGQALKDTVSPHDKSPIEKPYHMFVLGTLLTLKDTHYIESNGNSGEGRFDIALQPKDKQKKGVIIEIKVAGESYCLKKIANNAVNQILKKDYKQRMQTHEVKDFVLVSMVFRGQKVYVQSLVTEEDRPIEPT